MNLKFRDKTVTQNYYKKTKGIEVSMCKDYQQRRVAMIFMVFLTARDGHDHRILNSTRWT
jgi:hypothetical protein